MTSLTIPCCFLLVRRAWALATVPRFVYSSGSNGGHCGRAHQTRAHQDSRFQRPQRIQPNAGEEHGGNRAAFELMILSILTANGLLLGRQRQDGQRLGGWRGHISQVITPTSQILWPDDSFPSIERIYPPLDSPSWKALFDLRSRDR